MKSAHTIGGMLAAATLIAATAAPAFAAEQKQTLTYNAKSGNYCTKVMNTDSRIPRTICRTRAQWIAEGVKLPSRAEIAVAAR